ncbi:uncharacterized protein LOC115225104 isoform X1 [Octopus sinensis]|uniref:Uncharacterized protein LOC115225104 isoform X1 n=1 Tax=Octopus sinensis TaxID=2607531 RepID=A0A7E6FRI9_9MOLL|nr:uncharacterized protein LOC115225104 isoform X1 [Octopus sinensis]
MPPSILTSKLTIYPGHHLCKIAVEAKFSRVRKKHRKADETEGSRNDVEVKPGPDTKADETKGSRNDVEVKPGPDTKADETKGSRNVAVEAKASSMWKKHRKADEAEGSRNDVEVKPGPDTKADETEGSRNDMGTIKESGSNAPGTSMPNYAIIIPAIIQCFAAILL